MTDLTIMLPKDSFQAYTLKFEEFRSIMHDPHKDAQAIILWLYTCIPANTVDELLIILDINPNCFDMAASDIDREFQEA